MAAAGGRRTHQVAVHLSWPEADAWEAVRALDSHRAERPLSRADWLVQTIEARLREAGTAPGLPSRLTTRIAGALDALDAERARTGPPRAPGRPPRVW